MKAIRNYIISATALTVALLSISCRTNDGDDVETPRTATNR